MRLEISLLTCLQDILISLFDVFWWDLCLQEEQSLKSAYIPVLWNEAAYSTKAFKEKKKATWRYIKQPATFLQLYESHRLICCIILLSFGFRILSQKTHATQLLHKSSCCCSVETGTIADTKTIQTATNSEGEATGSGVTAPLCPGRKFRSYRKLSCAFGYLVPRNVLYTFVYSYSQVCSVMYKILSVLPLFGDTDLSWCFVICSLPSLPFDIVLLGDPPCWGLRHRSGPLRKESVNHQCYIWQHIVQDHDWTWSDGTTQHWDLK